jgi:hypothetical protein
MAEVVTVAVNDTITKIIQTKRGPKPNELYAWIDRVRKLNPHIPDPDWIHPHERLLIPDTLHEQVSEVVAWQNALRHTPPQMAIQAPMHYEIPVHLITPGDTVDKLAHQTFADSHYWNVPEGIKLAIFLNNNPRLYGSKWWKRALPMGTLANMTPFLLQKHIVAHWENQNPIFKIEYDQLRLDVRDLYATIGPSKARCLSDTVIKYKSQGAGVGLDDVAPAFVAGHAAASSMMLNQVNAVLQEITNDAVNKFGRGIVLSNKTVNLRQVEKFIKTHPRYGQAMQFLKEMPKQLTPEADIAHTLAFTKSPYANAKFFRKQIFMPSLKSNSTKSMGTIRMALNSNARVVRVISRGMYVVPIVLGICDVYSAPPERRVRTIFEEGFGVMGGYLGSEVGGALGGIIAISILGLGPLGLFVSIFLCASIGGVAGYGLLKGFGGKAYELNNNSGGRIYYSMDDLFGAY